MPDKVVDYDDLLSAAGQLGRYQILLFFSTFPFYLFGVFVYYTEPFITEVSDHWCHIPELENLTDIDRRTLAIPPDENLKLDHSRCRSYLANWSDVLSTGVRPNHTWNTVPCQYGWEFNKTGIPYPTITSEFEWVCDKNSYPNIALAMFYVGSVVGGLLMGWIADRFGRLPAAIISNIIGCVGGVMSTLSRSFIEFTLCRFFVGMASDSCMMMMYLLVLEYVAPRHRTLIASLSFALFYAPSVTLLPWLALACGHWKVISLVTSIPMALALLSPLVIPESPRWLLSRGKIDEAIEKVLMIAKVNKKEISPKLIENFKIAVTSKKEEETKSIFELLKRPILRRTFIFTCLVFMSCSLVFDALVRSIGLLEYDFFVSFSLLSFTEFPSLLLTAFVMDLLGRRWLTALVMIVSSVFTILTVFVGGGLPSVICAMVARFTANMGYGTVIQWSAEVLPTSVRGTGSSTVYILSDLITILTPYILYLETYINFLPLVIIGCVAALCGFLALFLPETARKEMPQTFEAAEEMVKCQKILNIPCLEKN